MKRYLKSIVLFLAFLGVVYPATTYVLATVAPPRMIPNVNYRRGSYGHMYSRLAEAETLTDVDVLILGSSHAYRGYDTRIFEGRGFEAFNLGSSAQTPIETEVLLKRYLEKLDPEAVIFDVCPGIFESDGVESSLDLIANDKNDIHTIRMAFEVNHIKTYNTLMFGLIHDLLRLDRSFSEPKRKGDDTYISGGFVERRITYHNPETHSPRQVKFNKKQLAALERCVEMIAERGAKLILIYAPMTSSFFEAYADNDVFDDTMRQYGLYYNFNLLIDLDDYRDFYDSNHLNQIGVEAFDKKLLDTIGDDLRRDR